MGLKEYQKKRDFRKTSEPKGEKKSTSSGKLYVIQKHDAQSLHYDFRLELDGVLKSWAVPKGPSLDPSEKRLAVHVEDHPIEYGSFEGIIPEDEYGGGTVMLWDKGEWKPNGDAKEQYEEGKLKFELKGKKLKGGWTLVKMSGKAGNGGKNWLLIKEKDKQARPEKEFNILEKKKNSVESGRSMKKIAESKDRVWSSEDNSNDKKKKSKSGNSEETSNTDIEAKDIRGSRKSRQPEEMRPQLATLSKTVPRGERWVHEIKYDGYRFLAHVRNGKARLLTRRGKDWTGKFSKISEAIESLPVSEAIFDGEIVVLTKQGLSDFQALQNYMKYGQKAQLVYYVFDLLYFGDYDLCHCALLDRKQLLKKILNKSDTGETLRFSDHIQGKGEEVYRHSCRLEMEGTISKRVDSNYVQKRSRNWVKNKCIHRQEFVVGGYTDPSGSRKGFGALVVGYYDAEENLVYCGRVGTGFNEKTLKDLYGRMQKIERQTAPFENPPKGREAKGVHWLKPELVAEVEFAGWTDDEVLRQPSYQGLREDKQPKQVGLERPTASVLDNDAEDTKTNRSRRRTGMKRNEEVEIAGVKLSNPDKVLYPEQGVTKRQIAEFYEEISDRILPFISGRPLSVVRCPDGPKKSCFYQKHIRDSTPEEIRGVPIREKEGKEPYIVIDDLKGLIALVQLGVLELHPWPCRVDKVERPDYFVFDLDPAPEVEWKAVVDAAKLLRERLQDLGLESFLKVSGGKGLHIMGPIARRTGWDELKAFAKAVADSMVESAPEKYLAIMSKQKRKNKIFIDYLRNSRGATSVAPYSTRAKEGAPVSTPIRWDELSSKTDPSGFTIENLRSRLSRLKKDPWEGYFDVRQSITKDMKKQLGVE